MTECLYATDIHLFLPFLPGEFQRVRHDGLALPLRPPLLLRPDEVDQILRQVAEDEASFGEVSFEIDPGGGAVEARVGGDDGAVGQVCRQGEPLRLGGHLPADELPVAVQLLGGLEVVAAVRPTGRLSRAEFFPVMGN